MIGLVGFLFNGGHLFSHGRQDSSSLLRSCKEMNFVPGRKIILKPVPTEVFYMKGSRVLPDIKWAFKNVVFLSFFFFF